MTGAEESDPSNASIECVRKERCSMTNVLRQSGFSTSAAGCYRCVHSTYRPAACFRIASRGQERVEHRQLRSRGSGYLRTSPATLLDEFNAGSSISRAFLSGSSSRRGPQGARTRCRCGTLATRPRTATTSHLHLGSRLRRRSQPCGDPPQYRHQAESTSKLGSDFALSATMNGSAYRPASRRWAIAPTLDTSKRNRPQLPQRRR